VRSARSSSFVAQPAAPIERALFCLRSSQVLSVESPATVPVLKLTLTPSWIAISLWQTHEDAGGQRDCEDGSGQDNVHGKNDPTHPGCGWTRNLNVFFPDLHSLNLFKGQLVPRSIINPGGRRTRMSGDPLSDLDSAAQIHVFGNTRRTEAVTTNSFRIPLVRARFSTSFNTLRRSRRLDSIVSRFLPKEGNSGALGFDVRYERSSQRSTASLAFECTGNSCSFPRFSWNRNQRVPPRS
jgi:hypothetical protein